MGKVSALFWDVGGVLLTNGWDQEGRSAAAARFHLDLEELERRHWRVAEAFETGGLDLDRYLAETVFDEPRSFTPAEFVEFMHSRSQPYRVGPGVRSLVPGGRTVRPDRPQQ